MADGNVLRSLPLCCCGGAACTGGIAVTLALTVQPLPQAEDAARAALVSGGGTAAADALLLPAHDLPAALFCLADKFPPELEPVLLGGPTARLPGSPCFVSAAQFAENWSVFTQNLLRGLDWSNVFAAGGAVLACATTTAVAPAGDAAVAAAAAEKTQLLFRARQAGAVLDAALVDSPAFLALHGRRAPGDLAKSDVDLWMFGLSPEEAAAKIEHIFTVLRQNAQACGADVFAARTANTITFFGAYPFRSVQVIVNMFDSLAHALLDFDLDCCALAYDGAKLLALPRAVNALCTRLNVMRADLEPTSRALARAYRYSRRGVGLALPRHIPTLSRGVVEPRVADDVFASAKLRLLLQHDVQVPLTALEIWRGDQMSYSAFGDLFPSADSCDAPPQTWVSGFAAPKLRCRDVIYASGPDKEWLDWNRSGAPKAPKPDPAVAAEGAAVSSACSLISSLYSRLSLRGANRPPRTFLDQPPDFPALIPRHCDYGIAEPDTPYGPPLPDDDGTAPLPELDLEPAQPFSGREARRPPVTAAEAAAMIEAPPDYYSRSDIVVARTAEELRARILNAAAPAGRAAMFSRAAFADKRVGALAGGGDAAVELLNTVFPAIEFSNASLPTSTTFTALGGKWRVALKTEPDCYGSAALVVSLAMLTPPPDTREDGRTLLKVQPAGVEGAPLPPALLPLNILLAFGGDVFLDSHVLFACAAGAEPQTWTHFLWWSHLVGRGNLRFGHAGPAQAAAGTRELTVVLQAACLT